MIRITTIFLVCFFIFTTDVCALSLHNQEKIQIINLESTNLEYNLGKIDKDKIIKKTIKIRNKLNEALEIKAARSTCECINVNIEPQTVERDGLFQIEIVFDSRGINQDVEEIAYIITKNMNYELIRLVISATLVK